MKTIRAQLTWKLLLGFTFLLAAGGLGIYFWMRAALQKEFDAEVRAKALAITSLTRQGNAGIKVDFSDRFMRGFDDRVATDFFQMWQTNGTSLERSESLGEKNLPCRFGTLTKPEFWDLRLPTGFPGRAVGFNFSPQIAGGTERKSADGGQISLVVASDRRELDQTLATFALVIGASGLLLLAATVLVVPSVLRKELGPLDQLADQAAAITAASLATRFPTEDIPGELAPISTRLNDLLGRLEQSFDRERRFSADLAHELRTPISELRSLAELALKWPEAREAITDRETLAIALQMEGIVSRLLALLRSERGQLPVLRERIALAPFIERNWKRFAQRAEAKDLQISCHVPANGEIETDPVLLRSILTNLLDNAVEYTPASGEVLIEASIQGARFTIKVVNTVQHLASEDLPRLFERFWRKDLARSSSDHSGLGLSLALAFAKALGYELKAELDGSSRLRLQVTGACLPNSAQSSK